MPELTIRRAVASDGPVLSDIARRSYVRYVDRIGRPPAPMVADYEAVASLGMTFVAEREGRAIALLVLAPMMNSLLLENVAVVPEEQGAGVGRSLLLLAEEEARRLGLAEVRLYTNATMTENLIYYARHGYRETHRGSTDGYDRVFFVKQLVPVGD
jgi:predicted N-acetyltransferase YhbS